MSQTTKRDGYQAALTMPAPVVMENNPVIAASENATGVVELATSAEAVQGTSTTLVPSVDDVAYESLAVGAGYGLGFRNDLDKNPQRDAVKLFTHWLSESPNGLNFGKSVTIGARRNLWQYTENLAHVSYSVTNAAKGTDTVIVDGITLTKFTASNFYSALFSPIGGLGLTPFTIGNYYLCSCFVLSAQDHEQWPGGSVTGNNSNGWNRRLVVPGKVRRIWTLGRATTTALLDFGGVPTAAFGATAGNNVYWPVVGGYPDGSSGAANSLVLYVGGFQFEEVTADGRYGFVAIGDSTTQGAAGGDDQLNSLEWVSMLGAHLNVHGFNRGVSGNQTTAMDTRWATDITPIAARCKYVIIQPSAANDIPNGISLATTQGAVNSMVAKAIADGLIPVLVVPPSCAGIDANSGYEATYASLCAWIRQTFPLVIDNAKVCNDPLNPYQLRRQTNWIGDGTHFGSEAKRAIALNAASYPWWDFPRPSPYQAIAVTTFTRPNFSTGAQTIGTNGVSINSVRHGTAALVAGTVTVADTTITAISRVLVNRFTDGGTVGASYSVTRTASTSFTITAKDGAGANQTADTSVLSYQIIEP